MGLSDEYGMKVNFDFGRCVCKVFLLNGSSVFKVFDVLVKFES